MTSVPSSGRAGVPIDAPEIGDVEHLAFEDDAFGQLQLLAAALGRDAFVAALVGPVELGAVGEPGQRCRQLLALVLGGAELEGEAAFELPHHGAFDAADVVEEGDHALADRRRRPGTWA